jgi:hypothetical protein
MVKQFSARNMYSNSKLIIEEAGFYIYKPFDVYVIKRNNTNEVVKRFKTLEGMYKWAITL